MDFSDTLNIILEDSYAWHPLTNAMDIVKRLDAAKQAVLDLQHELATLRNRINADLAIQVRKRIPALNVGLDKNGSCKIGYKTKHLTLTPDVENGLWAVNSPDSRFVNRFQKLNRRDLLIGSDLEPIIGAISSYFTNHYSTLGEDICGDGIILIDGKVSTLHDVIGWRNGNTPRTLLNSRSVKRQCLATA